MCQGIPEQAHLEQKIQVDVKDGEPPKPKMSCTQRVSIRLNSLESIWYCILVAFITVFLLGDALRQYKHYNNLDWPDKPPRGELRLYALLIFSAFGLIVLFIPTQIFKVGNRANDQDKLGIIKTRRNGFRRMSSSSSHIKRLRQYVYKLRGLSKHMGPIGATLHMLSAFCLLLPLMFLQARAIENGLLPTEMIWKSEVAVISAPEDLSLEHPSSVAATNLGVDSAATSVAPAHQSSDIIPNRDPFRVFMITINYLNYVVPLFFYAIRYAEVFWVSHKGFAFLFSAQLMMNAAHYALGFVGMSLMYKLSSYIHGPYNEMTHVPKMAPPPLLILAFLSMNITVFLSAVIFYLYGYSRYKLAESEVISTEVDGPQSKPFILKFNGLLPHVGAFFVFVILFLCKGFFIVEYIIVYSWMEGGDGRIMCCIFFDVLYLLAWFILWIMFAIKSEWKFGVFSHPAPYLNVEGPSDSDQDQGSSNSDTDVEVNAGHNLNHIQGTLNVGHNGEAETSFSDQFAANTSLLYQEQQENEKNASFGEGDGARQRNSIRFADEESSAGLGIDSNHATPVKSPSKRKSQNSSITQVEGKSSDEETGKSGLMTEVSLDDDSPTVSSPMLPLEA